MPGRMPEHMPEDMPDRMPDRMSYRMPEHMPEDMPGRMPEDMPDRMRDRMPEDMSDRMPEDLPIRKRINVMMGMTRSKVILVFWGVGMGFIYGWFRVYLYHASWGLFRLEMQKSRKRRKSRTVKKQRSRKT